MMAEREEIRFIVKTDSSVKSCLCLQGDANLCQVRLGRFTTNICRRTLQADLMDGPARMD
jgi:hypothetical protein